MTQWAQRSSILENDTRVIIASQCNDIASPYQLTVSDDNTKPSAQKKPKTYEAEVIFRLTEKWPHQKGSSMS